MPSWLDLIAVAVVGVALLVPAPSIEAHPALMGDQVELDRIAELEDALATHPDDPALAVALANGYLRFDRADWALAVTDRFVGRTHAVHLVRATAQAERLEVAATVAEAKRGQEICDKDPAACPEPDRIRMRVVAGAMQALLDAHVDPRKDPRGARQAVSEVLRAAKPPAPPTTPSSTK